MCTKRFGIQASFLLVFLTLISCSRAIAYQNETWTIVQLLSKGERIETNLQVVDVRNCNSSQEVKSFSCTAGTSNNFTTGLSLGGEIGVSIESSVSSGLGFNRTSGESLELETPGSGYVNRYLIAIEYHVFSGEVLARSSAGTEQNTQYSFQSNCTLRIESVEKITCDEALQGIPTMNLPTPHPINSPQPIQADTPAISQIQEQTAIPIIITTIPQKPFIEAKGNRGCILEIGGETIQLLEGEDIFDECALSPNAERIVGINTYDADIYVINLDGSNMYLVDVQATDCYGGCVYDVTNIVWIDDHNLRLRFSHILDDYYSYKANDIELGDQGEFTFTFGEFNYLENVTRLR